MFQFALIPIATVFVFAAGLYSFNTTRNVTTQTPVVENMNAATDQSYSLKQSSESIVRDYNPYKGPKDAKVVVVVFMDFQCPGCAAAHPVEQIISKKYNSNVKFVSKMFPLKAIHPNAESAAKSALAAAKQGKYFEYADMLFTSQIEPGLNLNNQEQFAKDLGLDINQWKQDRESSEIASYIATDYNDGINAVIPDLSNPSQTTSVDSTPTFIFMKNGQIQYKANGMSTDDFSQRLDDLLK